MYIKHCRWVTLGLLLLVLATLVGCAEERPPIDRVQTFALEKKFFVGEDLLAPEDNPEFWTQATLIDVGYGASQSGLFTSTYAQPMSRIHWQITEDYLLARLAYERISGSDGKGVGDKTMEGIIVAAFPIEKHFDIVWAYNSTTGEKLNILEENDADRPWYEREYFRVDFSANESTDNYDFDTLSLLGVYGGITYEPLKFYVDDPNSPDAPFFDMESGYFDVTNKAFAKPGVVDLSHLGWGIDSFPACFLDNDFFSGSFPAGMCAPVELTIRHAFRKVVDSDYEPVHWDGWRFQAYGGFYLERYGYARNYGMVDEHWHRFLTRYQIWERSHYYSDPVAMTGAIACNLLDETTAYGENPHRDDNGNGTEDECEAVTEKTGFMGSRCDEFRNMCTLPYRARTPKTIAWYYTEGSNPEYFDASALATHEWDVALRSAVMTAKYGECNKVGDDDCLKDYPVYFGQQDDNEEAVRLSLEVDDCRHGIAYTAKNGNEEQCVKLADEIGSVRSVVDGVKALAKMDEMIVLCHSPVRSGDPKACGDKRMPAGKDAEACAALVKEVDAALDMDDNVSDEQQVKAETCRNAIRVRRGDLRYHQINGIVEPQTPSPWGIYTDAEDPLTGETISASVNVWTWVNELWSQKVVDQMRYIKGELETSDVTEGQYVDDWAAAAEAAGTGGVLPKLSRMEMKRRMADFTGGEVDQIEVDIEKFKANNPELYEQTRAVKEEFAGVMASSGAPSTMSAVYNARRQAAQGSEMEAQLMNQMMQQLYGVEGYPINDGLMDMVSPLRGGNPTFMREIQRLKQDALAKQGRCIMYEHDTPLAMTGLTDILEYKFGAFNPDDAPDVQFERAEKMRRYIARRAHMAVIVHEMGHSIGMRHNFVSSSDAWGFRPQYWQLRTQNGKVNKECSELDATGETCVGPRWFDPLTDLEKDNLIHMFMHSSVMEYAGETTQDFLGLGVYDFATARMFYGDTVAVHKDDSYKIGSDRGEGMMSKMDSFGGILGIQPRIGDQDIHYSLLNKEYDLIKDCKTVNPELFKPARWDEESMGKWDPVLDGRIVYVDGAYSMCRQQEVDYVPWTALRAPTDQEFGGYARAREAVDDQGRVRMPYGFATDRWADLGNLSVYRHDNGADAYEIFNFLITQQEVGHIWDNYRRGRQTFSVRSAAGRTLGRFNEKIRDGAKGLTLMKNFYAGFYKALGYNFDLAWPIVAPAWFSDNILASGMVFDHFTRMVARPQSGPHYQDPVSPILRSIEDAPGIPGTPTIIVPDGATGKYGNVLPGGRPVENRLASNMGEYDSELTINAGSYYDKIYTAMLLTESVDNFISDSRGDFVDARYRATSLADLFPDGYRRFLGNLLTNDEFLKGSRIAVNDKGVPEVNADGYPERGIGYTSWWGKTPKACFPNKDSAVCSSFGSDSEPFNDNAPPDVAVLDAQVGWETQKFFIAWTLLYLPENQKQKWLDMMRIWELGKDADPGFENRIELHYPNGKSYIAKSFGQEFIYGKKVQKGIAGRILQYANNLIFAAYDTQPGPDLNGDGDPDWYIPEYNANTGAPLVKYDPTVMVITEDLMYVRPGSDGCNAQDNSACTCAANRACMELEDYMEVPFFLRQTLDAYDLVDPHPKGIYD
jgi:hypothetical protein